MNKDEALSKLELEEGATSSEINTQYQEFYNEFQMRITNAPTEHQRKLYQKKLEELTTAFKVLGGENQENNTQELPGIAESEVVETENRAKSSASNQTEISKEKALQILGLGEKITEKELENAFKSKVLSCESGRDNAINDSIRNAYQEAIIECNSAHKLLKEYIFIVPPIVKVTRPIPQVVKNSSASKKKWVLPVSIVSGVIIVIILFFAFGNGRSSTDDVNEIQLQAHHDKYVSLKSQADLLAKQKNWQEALFKYEEAYVLVEEREVKDSVESMMDHLFNAAKEKEAESKRIKIGDMHEGGIVFKIDAKGKHGLVCAPKDLGKYDWDEAEIACQNLTLNGYSDWYLPTKYELDSMYKIIGQGSSIGNVGGFTDGYYWSSTTVESDDFYPCRFNKNFTNGAKSQSSFYNDNYVRAVRMF